MIQKIFSTLAIVILIVINNAFTNDDIPYAAAIIGGEAINIWKPTTPRHQVTIFLSVLGYENGTDFCGGSILAKRYILTAAHCVLNETGSKPGPLYVTAGAIRMNHPTAKTRKVRRIYVPRLVNGTCGARQPEVDLAVLELDRDLNINNDPYVRKVDLPEPLPSGTYDTYENKTALIVGFGVTDMVVDMHDNFEFKTSSVRYPKNLQVAKVDILSQDQCTRAWKKKTKIHPFQLICGRVQGESFRGVCEGDNGNGLIYQNKIIGVLSYGNKLCYEGTSISIGQPAVYLRITSFLPFIKGVLNDDIAPNSTCSFDVSHSGASELGKFPILLIAIIMTILVLGSY